MRDRLNLTKPKYLPVHRLIQKQSNTVLQGRKRTKDLRYIEESDHLDHCNKCVGMFSNLCTFTGEFIIFSIYLISEDLEIKQLDL